MKLTKSKKVYLHRFRTNVWIPNFLQILQWTLISVQSSTSVSGSSAAAVFVFELYLYFIWIVFDLYLICTVWSVWSGQTRRSLFLGRLWVYERSDCCSRTVWDPRMLEISWNCFSSNFVYNFNKTPWFPLMWMIRFVTFVHKYLSRNTSFVNP